MCALVQWQKGCLNLSSVKRTSAQCVGAQRSVLQHELSLITLWLWCAQRLSTVCCCASFGFGLLLSAVPLHAPASLDAQAGSQCVLWRHLVHLLHGMCDRRAPSRESRHQLTTPTQIMFKTQTSLPLLGWGFGSLKLLATLACVMFICQDSILT